MSSSYPAGVVVVVVDFAGFRERRLTGHRSRPPARRSSSPGRCQPKPGRGSSSCRGIEGQRDARDRPWRRSACRTRPSRSGRFPKVISISGVVPSGHSGASLDGERLPVTMVVVVELVVGAEVDVVEVVVDEVDVVVVEEVVVVEDVVVGATVEVVVDGAVVVLVDVVVVPPWRRDIQIRTGSGWPMSKAITTERPWASANSAPMKMTPRGIEWTSTLIGLSPVCNRSSTPGVPTNLQTNTL